MEQQDETTQDKVTAPLTVVTWDTTLVSVSDWKCLNELESSDVGCRIKVSDKTATGKPIPRPDSGPDSDSRVTYSGRSLQTVSIVRTGKYLESSKTSQRKTP